MIDLSIIQSEKSKAGRCIDIGYSIGATNKILNDGKRYFLLKLLRQVMKSQVWDNVNRKT